MNKQMLRVLLISAVSIFWYSAAFGQTATQNTSPTISAVASTDRVRITAPSSVVQMRVEVYEGNGTKVWDSDIRGNIFDWHVQNGSAERLNSGDYACVVTVKNLAGKVTQRVGTIQVGENELRVGRAETARLSAPQTQAIGPIEEDASWTTLDEQQNQTTTIIAHDGTDGEITRGRGAFSFRLGDFYSGNSREQMRLSEAGNLGIGTSNPKFKLDVAGAIRARSGFVFKDGSTLNVSDKGVLTRTSVDGSITPNAAGTGTQGRLAKWTDNAGTLGDSIITENGGLIGIGNPNPDSLVNIQGAIPTLLGKMVVIRSTGANNGFGLQMDAVGSGNNALGLGVNGVPKAAFSWDNSRQFLGLVNFAYSANDFALRVNSDGSLTFHDGATSTERFRISKDGNALVNGSLTSNIVSATTQYNLAGFRLLTRPGPDSISIGFSAGNAPGTVRNTFVGESAGAFTAVNGIDTAFDNSAFGVAAGQLNTTGHANTFIGAFADAFSGNLVNATAIGYNARVGASNSLVLGSGGTNVGIGTSTPGARLHVVDNGGNILFGAGVGCNAGFAGLSFASSLTCTNYSLLGDGLNTYINRSTGGAIYFRENNNTQLTITSGGSVGINTPSPDSLLTVNGGASKPGGGSWAVFSDERLKNIKGRFTPGLKAVMRLQPVHYQYKPNNALDIKSEGEHVGFSAQAVQKVIPEAVMKNAKGYLLINNDPIMWTMLNAIKEQQAIIDHQQNEINGLKRFVYQSRRVRRN